jgi:hypothetical protein
MVIPFRGNIYFNPAFFPPRGVRQPYVAFSHVEAEQQNLLPGAERLHPFGQARTDICFPFTFIRHSLTKLDRLFL